MSRWHLFGAADITFKPRDDGLAGVDGLSHRVDLLPVAVDLLSGGFVQAPKLVQLTPGALLVLHS